MKPFFAATILIALLSSCLTMAFKHMGVYDTHALLTKFSNSENKAVLYLPMHHVGTSAFYSSVSQTIDSLNELGYIVFYELVTSNLKDSTSKDTYLRKYRKIRGFISKEGYLDSTNTVFYGKYKYKGKMELINQPPYSKLNVDSTSAVKADVTLEKLIDCYEDKYGKIMLKECDLNTPLDSAYQGENPDIELRKQFGEYAIKELRNKNLAEMIAKTDSSKIVVIYGKAHLEGLLPELLKIDSTWHQN